MKWLRLSALAGLLGAAALSCSAPFDVESVFEDLELVPEIAADGTAELRIVNGTSHGVRATLSCGPPVHRYEDGNWERVPFHGVCSGVLSHRHIGPGDTYVIPAGNIADWEPGKYRFFNHLVWQEEFGGPVTPLPEPLLVSESFQVGG